MVKKKGVICRGALLCLQKVLDTQQITPGIRPVFLFMERFVGHLFFYNFKGF